MYRTISLKLAMTKDEELLLQDLQRAFSEACQSLVPVVVEERCWNRFTMHNLVYSSLREKTPLGSQMSCNVIFAVCKAYQSQVSLGHIKKDKPVPKLGFRAAAVHFDKRTYSFTKQGQLSLYTLSKRIKVSFSLGEKQRMLFESGKQKEAELIYKRGCWYFNLVLEIPRQTKIEAEYNIVSRPILGVDVGENNLAATSTGKVFEGGVLRHTRDRYLARRRRLQSNGTQSAKQLLCKVSGKERRHVQYTNHVVSKAIIKEAVAIGASTIVLEDLTDIREHIKSGKRIRSRLHRWPFRQLQQFVVYKAEEFGIGVCFVNPAYSSVTCSNCLSTGQRRKHCFTCSCCGLRAHADCNASRNLARIGMSADAPRAAVSRPNVDALRVP